MRSILSVLEYFYRFSIYITSIFIGGIIGSIWFVFRGRSYENAWYIAQYFLRTARFMGIETNFVTRENYNPSKPVVMVANHQSILDPIVMADIWPKRMCTIMKESLKYLGPFGIICMQSNTYFINRSDRMGSVETLNKAAEHIKREQCSILVFPEGTRHNSINVLPFKKGAFHIAIQTGFPIQPVVVSSMLNFVDHSQMRFTKAKPDVIILPQISSVGKSVDELMAETYSVIKETFEKTVPKEYLQAHKVN